MATVRTSLRGWGEASRSAPIYTRRGICFAHRLIPQENIHLTRIAKAGRGRTRAQIAGARGYRGGSTNRGRTVGRERNASLGRRLLVIDAIFDRGHHRGTFPTAGCPRRATPLLPESLFGVLGGLTSAPRRGLVVTRRCREITRFCATEGGARSLRPARQAGHQLGHLEHHLAVAVVGFFFKCGARHPRPVQ